MFEDFEDTTIDLLRHGEPEGGRKYRGYGVDDPLTEKGWAQMWESVGDSNHWDVIVSSPLKRCSAFAEKLSEYYALPLEIQNDLEEIGFGEWEGKTPDELLETDPDGFESFYRDPVNCRPTGAEDLDVFFDRVTKVYQSICETYVGKRVLIVAHAGVIRAVLASVLDCPPGSMYRFSIDNATMSRIIIKPFTTQLACINRKGI